MTLSEFVSKYDGKIVADGQCGNLVRQYWIEVDQTSPPSYPNSNDYWSQPVPGYNKIKLDPHPGDIAIYDGHGIYTEGHSAVYVGNSQVFEQNADPDGSPAHIYARAPTYLLGYLRKQGEDMSEPADYKLNSGDAVNMFQAILGRPATDADIKYYTGRIWKDAVYDLVNSQEYKDRISGSDSDAQTLKPGVYQVK